MPTLLVGCLMDPSEQGSEFQQFPRFDILFTTPGTHPLSGVDNELDQAIADLIDNACCTLDMAFMGFTRPEVLHAIERAWHRGVRIRFVGDTTHAERDEAGYALLAELGIDVTIGNAASIMHNKFAIVDGRFIFFGTANITNTGLMKSNNNIIMMESIPISILFQSEFEQMYGGLFGDAKSEENNRQWVNEYYRARPNLAEAYCPVDDCSDAENIEFYSNTFFVPGTRYGDLAVEVYFSPHMNTVGTMVDYILNAQNSVYFSIFAFTKDEIGAGFVEKAEEFAALQAADPTRTPVSEVRGVLDRSQLPSNGPGHEVFRLAANGVNFRMDGNVHTNFPGDDQGGGGRLHSKTMVIDYATESITGSPDTFADDITPVTITGSFNWSNNATRNNDETLVIVRDLSSRDLPDGSRRLRVSDLFKEEFDTMWDDSLPVPGMVTGSRVAKDEASAPVGDDGLAPLDCQDVIISEINWRGSLPNDRTTISDECKRDSSDTHPCDEYIELRNLTNSPIDISYWSIVTNNVGPGSTTDACIPPGFADVVVGIPEGMVIPPNGYFLIVDHLTDAYVNADFVLNVSNDFRFPRLNFINAGFYLELRDGQGSVIDRIGDGETPFSGGLGGDDIVRSMERINAGDINNVPSGLDAASWGAAQAASSNISGNHNQRTFGTPGSANSVDG